MQRVFIFITLICLVISCIPPFFRDSLLVYHFDISDDLYSFQLSLIYGILMLLPMILELVLDKVEMKNYPLQRGTFGRITILLSLTIANIMMIVLLHSSNSNILIWIFHAQTITILSGMFSYSFSFGFHDWSMNLKSSLTLICLSTLAVALSSFKDMTNEYLQQTMNTIAILLYSISCIFLFWKLNNWIFCCKENNNMKHIKKIQTPISNYGLKICIFSLSIFMFGLLFVECVWLYQRYYTNNQNEFYYFISLTHIKVRYDIIL